MTTPITRVITSAYRRKNMPTVPLKTLTAMNTSVNPAMNSSVPNTSRDRAGADADPPRGETAPPMYPR